MVGEGASLPALAIDRIKRARFLGRQAPTRQIASLVKVRADLRVRVAVAAGLSRRTAYYLASIAEALDRRLIAPDDLASIGWTKARVLAAKVLRTNRAVSAASISRAQKTPAVTFLRQGK